VNYIPNFKSLAHTVPEILLNYTENRQNGKFSCRILVTLYSIPNFKSLALTVLEIFCLQTEGQTDTHTHTHTHGPMAETLDLGSRDLKPCFGTNKLDPSLREFFEHRKFDPITLLFFL
jgi:hypothetical protein